MKPGKIRILSTHFGRFDDGHFNLNWVSIDQYTVRCLHGGKTLFGCVEMDKGHIESEIENITYHQISNIRGTKSHNLNVSRLVLPLSLRNLLKPGVKSRTKV